LFHIYKSGVVFETVAIFEWTEALVSWWLLFLCIITSQEPLPESFLRGNYVWEVGKWEQLLIVL